ncbi:MAG TPA: L-serine ammonia-lyase [Caulifigura sp.]|nr:L-serine ammonia-lyase [Caulifigura sp.]
MTASEAAMPAAKAGPTPYYGVFDLFKIGIGPSSSHSVGPMRAAAAFAKELAEKHLLASVERVQVDLYGSLALTGIGHGTDSAVLLGLEAETPENVDPAMIAEKLARIRQSRSIHLAGDRSVPFVEERDLVFNRRETLDFHPNGMRFQAFGTDGREPLLSVTCFSIGGGFVVREGETAIPSQTMDAVPYPFSSARDLLELAQRTGKSFSALALKNELAFRSEIDIRQGLRKIREVMRGCIDRGCATDGILPGGLNVVRRAPALYQKLEQRSSLDHDPLLVLDWVDLYAIAVNEENAAGGRVVTAPTNGAAGIIPAVLQYFTTFCRADEDKADRFLLTAGLIGALYKTHASISGAEVGCQGEVGVACSMAAGALTEVLGGTPRQVEQAAEIGMEHNLGLTCDPIKGLVQIPCIERNAMGAVKAINASRIALRGDGSHMVSLDRVIRVMKRTGADMSSRYKETSEGGLAVNVTEC